MSIITKTELYNVPGTPLLDILTTEIEIDEAHEIEYFQMRERGCPDYQEWLSRGVVEGWIVKLREYRMYG